MRRPEKESVRRLQEAIRNKRREVGIQGDAPIQPRRLLEAIKKTPPMEELIQYIRRVLAEDRGNRGGRGSMRNPTGRFKKRV